MVFAFLVFTRTFTKFLILVVLASGVAFSSAAHANHEGANPRDVETAREEGFDPHTECTFVNDQFSQGRDCKREPGEINFTTVTASIVGSLAAMTLVIWLVWPDGDDDDFEFVQWKALEGDNYLPPRSWFGVERNLTREAKVLLGVFWAKGDSAESFSAKDIFPNEDNIGLELLSVYDGERWGQFSLTSAIYYQGYGDRNNGYISRGLDTHFLLRWKGRW